MSINESRLTIHCMLNENEYIDISVYGKVDSYLYFKEAFLSLDRPTPVRDITDKETGSESAANSATTTFLSNLIGIIRKSVKTGGHIISENELNKTFIFSDLIAIRKLVEIAGIKFDKITRIEFDESKFNNRREFHQYFGEIMKVELGKEDFL